MRRALALLALFTGFAILHTWPLASNLAGLSRLDNDDAGLNIFIMGWVAHVMSRDPLALFHAPIFFPERYTLAYSEHMLVPSLMGAPLIGAGVAPATVYNLLILAGFALSGWSMALVVRRWTDSTLAGVMAGLLYAFNAHLLTRLVHLQALHLEFLPVALLALDQVLRAEPRDGASVPAATTQGPPHQPWAPNREGLGPPALPAALLTASFVLQGLCSNYTLVFLSVALLVAALARGDEWLPLGRRHRFAALVTAGLAAVALSAPFLWPYYVVSRDVGLGRGLDEVALHSAGWADYLATGGRLHYTWWSHRWFEGRTALFPGVSAVVLASIALVRADTRRDPRVRMIAAIGLVGFALSFGPALPVYAWLHAHVPLFQGLRGAARWGLLPLSSIAMLAGFTVGAWERRWGRSPYWPAAGLALAGVVTLEALRAPLVFARVPPISTLYDRLREDPRAVVVELPLYGGPSVSENARYLFAATRHFRPLVNGYSGFESEGFRQRAQRWRRFPQTEVLQEMRELGVTYVVVHTGQLDPAQVAAAAERPELALVESDASARLYRLRRPVAQEN